MAAFATYSTTPDVNVTCGGINIAENCPAANVNNVIRQILTEGKQLNTLVAAIDTSTLMAKAGGAFTGDITRNSAGGYLYHNSSSLSGGKIYVQPSATSLPSSPAEGTIVMQY